MERFEPIQCACTNLKMASRAVGRVYDEALAPTGLNATQYAILVNVGRYAPIPQMSLADHLELERTSLYRAVALMEKRGWIKSSESGEGVAKVLELTKEGDRLVCEAKFHWEKAQSEFVRTFGKKRWDEFLSSLRDIRAHFSEKIE